MTTTIANTEMINTHAAMAIAVIAVVAGVMRPNALLPFASFAVLSFPLIPNRPSSPPLPNCCCWMPFAMRRLPAGDAFMHPPENNWQRRNKNKPKWVKSKQNMPKQGGRWSEGKIEKYVCTKGTKDRWECKIACKLQRMPNNASQPHSQPYCSTISATFARAPRLSKMELHLGRHYHDITQFIFAYKLINYTNATRCLRLFDYSSPFAIACVCACEPVSVGVMHALHGGWTT